MPFWPYRWRRQRRPPSARKVPLYQHIADINGSSDFTMPVPMMNILNGGEHADNNVDIQEFMVQPVAAPTFAEALRAGAEIFHHLKKVLSARGLSTAVGDEGGFAPNLPSNEAALEVIAEAVGKAGYKLGSDVTLALDCAASEFYRDGVYDLAGEGKQFSSDQFSDYLADLARAHPIISIEDGLDESDWDGWKLLTDKIGDKVQLVGDDLFVTNTKILKQGIDMGVANSILIKFNQIGSLTKPWMRSPWPRPPATPRLSPIDPERPRTPPSQTWRWQLPRARSKPAPCVAPTGSPSTTACCV